MCFQHRVMYSFTIIKFFPINFCIIPERIYLTNAGIRHQIHIGIFGRTTSAFLVVHKSFLLPTIVQGGTAATDFVRSLL